MNIKICGVRDRAGAEAAAAAGVNAIGFVFARSPRRVAPTEARRIAADLPAGLLTVAVFRSADAARVRRVLDVFDADRVQVEPHPSLRDPDLAGRLLPVLHDGAGLAAAEAAAARLVGGGPVVFEGPGRGGRGVRADWRRAAALARRRPTWLAGGLTPENVAAAVARVRPVGVDVSSGVEVRPGEKSAARIVAFVAAARAAAARAALAPAHLPRASK